MEDEPEDAKGADVVVTAESYPRLCADNSDADVIEPIDTMVAFVAFVTFASVRLEFIAFMTTSLPHPPTTTHSNNGTAMMTLTPTIPTPKPADPDDVDGEFSPATDPLPHLPTQRNKPPGVTSDPVACAGL